MKDLERLIKVLKRKKLTVAAAESASGGYLCYLLTKIPGSSEVFKGGVIVYSLDSKNILLKIPAPLLKKTQGVSREVAVRLAKGVAKKLKADIGTSIVGFAGPGPCAGRVYLATAYKDKLLAKEIRLKGSRDSIRKKSSQTMIKLLVKILSR